MELDMSFPFIWLETLRDSNTLQTNLISLFSPTSLKCGYSLLSHHHPILILIQQPFFSVSKLFISVETIGEVNAFQINTEP